MNTKTTVVVVVLFCLGFTALGETPQEKGLRIAQVADQADLGWKDWSVDDALMTLTGYRRGDGIIREFSIRQLEVEGDGDMSWVRFDTPKDVRGTKLLTHAHPFDVDDDDQWLYAPITGRVKRIAGNKSGSFVASEFSYEDFTPQEVSEYSYLFLREEELDGVLCFVIERRSLDPKSGYSRQVVWIDQAEHRFRKIVYYDKEAVLLKTLTITGYQQYGQWWRADRMVMEHHKEDHDESHQKCKTTTLEWGNHQFGRDLTKRDFDPNSLKRSR